MPTTHTPRGIKSHIHHENIDRSKGEFPLIPTFRLPTLIHYSVHSSPLEKSCGTSTH